jgi:hypothetical protein
MKLKQECRVLKQTALESLIFTIEAFNSPHEAECVATIRDGRAG